VFISHDRQAAIVHFMFTLSVNTHTHQAAAAGGQSFTTRPNW